jgi:hypothetical protein
VQVVIKPSINEDDLKYLCAIDIQYEYSCETFGCLSEGICRCGVITDVELTKNSFYTGLQLVKIYSDAGGVEKLIDFLYLKNLDKKDFVFHTMGTYYGQELSSYNYIGDVSYYNSLPIKDKLKFVLSKEYGYILLELGSLFRDDGLNLTLLQVPVNDCKSSVSCNEDKVNEIKNFTIAGLKNKQYKKFLKEVERIGIIIPFAMPSANKYLVIDGHHRLEAYKRCLEYFNKDINKEKINILTFK